MHIEFSALIFFGYTCVLKPVPGLLCSTSNMYYTPFSILFSHSILDMVLAFVISNVNSECNVMWIKRYIFCINWIIVFINILQFIFIDSAKTSKLTQNLLKSAQWELKYGHFWFKLPFPILKMSEMNSASSVTPKTTPIPRQYSPNRPSSCHIGD